MLTCCTFFSLLVDHPSLLNAGPHHLSVPIGVTLVTLVLQVDYLIHLIFNMWSRRPGYAWDFRPVCHGHVQPISIAGCIPLWCESLVHKDLLTAHQQAYKYPELIRWVTFIIEALVVIIALVVISVLAYNMYLVLRASLFKDCGHDSSGMEHLEDSLFHSEAGLP